MIKLVIFDLDGVLVDAKDIHYEAMNRALSQLGFPIISRDEHLAKYDGLPTKKKMEMLGIPEIYRNMLWSLKQSNTLAVITETIKPDHQVIETARKLKEDGYRLACASNSVRATLELMLKQSGLIEYFPLLYSNEDVIKPKPSPEIYMRAMLDAGVSPKETLVVEDSHIGRRAAYESGAYVCGVRDSSEVTYERILTAMPTNNNTRPKWQGGSMNIVIPAAGLGSRFSQLGYTYPKPLLDVRGMTMLEMVVRNINAEGHYIFIVQKEHYDKYNLKHLLNVIAPRCSIITVDSVTDGAACTTLLAEHLINSNNPLLICNSDQFVELDSNQFFYSVSDPGIDGAILTHNSTHPKWSYCEVDEYGWVRRVAEKEVISNYANVGWYYWQRGSDYVKYAKQMIDKDIRVRGEYYVAPVTNEAVQDGKKIKIFPCERMWGCGDPESFEYFLENYEGNI